MASVHLKPALAAILLAATCVAGSSQAAVSSVALTGTNTDITTYTDGSVYSPLYNSTQTLAGISFTFNKAADGSDAIIGGPVTIATNIANASTVYTLVNSAFGALGSDAGSITFNGSLGAAYTVHFIEGDNIRDHYYGDFVNSTTSSSVTQAVWGVNAPGNAHLDMQTIVLPTAFNNQVLTSIVFDSSNRGAPGGEAFLAGVSVSAVPEPSVFAMLLLGLGLTGAAVHRQRRS
jgi:hypothetical protein